MTARDGEATGPPMTPHQLITKLYTARAKAYEIQAKHGGLAAWAYLAHELVEHCVQFEYPHAESDA